MKRRDFIKASGVIAAASVSGINLETFASQKPQTKKIIFPRYKGFNITNKTSGTGPDKSLMKKILKLWQIGILTLHEFQCPTGIGHLKMIGII